MDGTSPAQKTSHYLTFHPQRLIYMSITLHVKNLLSTEIFDTDFIRHNKSCQSWKQLAEGAEHPQQTGHLMDAPFKSFHHRE